MIVIIDYGMGNLRSVQKAFETVGAEAKISSNPDEILSASSVVLPGVGAFGDCMRNLENLNLTNVVHKSIQSGKPFLGICLGLQLLFDASEEFGPVRGLGVLRGKVARFSFPSSCEPLKVPHMGWNSVKVVKHNSFFESIPDDSYFYFVHSYYVLPDDPEIVATTTSYGIDFVSGIQHENVYAFQFHPEKSQHKGLALLRKFSRLN
jgi:glutamine amidotransferase